MRIRVASPNGALDDEEIARIENDLEKIARRLHEFDEREEITADVRVKKNEEGINHEVTLEVTYGRHHVVGNTLNTDVHAAVREVRDDVLRQINDKSRRGHSSFVKGR